MHGAAAACVARGGQEAGGVRRSGSWHGHDAALAVSVGAVRMMPRRVRARTTTGSCFKRRLRLTSGPRHFLFNKTFKHPHLIFKLVTF
jgi:hypothetical protein